MKAVAKQKTAIRKLREEVRALRLATKQLAKEVGLVRKALNKKQDTIDWHELYKG